MRELHNARTNYGINVEFGLLFKLGKRDALTSRKLEPEFILVFFNFWSICCYPEAGIQMHDP